MMTKTNDNLDTIKKKLRANLESSVGTLGPVNTNTLESIKGIVISLLQDLIATEVFPEVQVIDVVQDGNKIHVNLEIPRFWVDEEEITQKSQKSTPPAE